MIYGNIKTQANIINFAKQIAKEQNFKLIKRLPKHKIISAWGAGIRGRSVMPIIEQYVTIKKWYDMNNLTA
jgi:hypothetical protein